MIKYLFRFAVLAILFVAITGCGTRSVKPKFSVVEVDTLIVCGSVGCNVHYRFTSIANADLNPALQAIEEANIQYFFGLEEFCGTAHEALSAALVQVGINMDGGNNMGNEAEYTESVEAEVAVVDSVLVYTITSANYMGGAHGLQTVEVHNYSLSGGYELALNDLLTAEQRATVDLLIRRVLYDRYGVSDDEGLSAQGFFPDYIRADENFAVTPDGLVFYFNPYDIGCYALGIIETFISKADFGS